MTTRRTGLGYMDCCTALALVRCFVSLSRISCWPGVLQMPSSTHFLLLCTLPDSPLVSRMRCPLIRGDTHGHIRTKCKVRRQAGNCVPVWYVSRVPVVPGIPGYSVDYHSDRKQPGRELQTEHSKSGKNGYA